MSTRTFTFLNCAATATSLLLLVAAATPVAALVPQIELLPTAELAVPPLPDPGVYPVQLVVDDDTPEASVGIADGPGARQALWFQRFEAPGSSFRLHEIWILFPPIVPLGGPVEIAVLRDADGDPTNGATLVTSFMDTVQHNDGVTFSIYSLGVPLEIEGPGDVLIGFVNRYLTSGSPPVNDVLLDTTASAGRSWFAVWNGADPPSPPSLPGDLATQTIDSVAPGNWMIRGFGVPFGVLEIPTLDRRGALGLCVLLAIASLIAIRRRSARTASETN